MRWARTPRPPRPYTTIWSIPRCIARASSWPCSKRPPQSNETPPVVCRRRPPDRRAPRRSTRPVGPQGPPAGHGRPQPSEAIRKLPRRITPNLPATPAPVRPAQAPRPLSEDRSRPLLRGDISPLSAGAGAGKSPRAPAPARRPDGSDTPRCRWFEATPVPNRWQIFPRRRTGVMRTSASPPSRRPRDCSIPTIATPTRATTRSPDAGSSSPSPRVSETHRGKPPHPRAVRSQFHRSRRIRLLRPRRAVALPAEFPLWASTCSAAAPVSNPSISKSKSLRSSTSTTPSRARTDFSYIDVRRGTHRTDTAIGMQELYVEKRLFAGKAFFDFTSASARASSASPAISAASFSATNSPARASSATSTTTSSSTIWRTSTCWRRTPTAA